MKAEPLGDSALILRNLPRPAYEVAQNIQSASIAGVIEAVASYDTVGVYFDPYSFSVDSLSNLSFVEIESRSRLIEVPVCYDMGEDLQEVGAFLGLSTQQVAEMHSGQIYRCHAVGFCPGFPYLGYLPETLRGVPRRAAPRVRIVPGSVAITGNQTGIYPLERPGGWAIIGRTPLCLVDPESAYFPIKAGDEIRFFEIDVSEFDKLKGQRL